MPGVTGKCRASSILRCSCWSKLHGQQDSLLELASPTLEGKLFWDDFQFIGSMFLPLLLLVFAFEYTGQQRSLSRPMRVGLFTFPVLFLIFLYTNPLHGWIRTTAEIVPGKPFDSLLYEFTGPMWVSFAYSYLTYFVASILFIRNLFRQQRLFRRQSLIIILGFTFPFLGSIPGMVGLLIFGQRDITSYTFGIGNLVFAWGLFRYGLFDVVPIARDAIMEYLKDVIIVLDFQSRIVDINPAALSGLEMTANQIIGTSILKVLSDRPDLVELFHHEHPVKKEVEYTSPNGAYYIFNSLISPLRDRNNKIIGRLLVAYDVTEQRQMQAKLRQAHDDLELRVQRRTEELERANAELEAKNAELERFTYTVSHDLKSPLVTISGFLGYIEEDAASGNTERLKRDIESIQKAASKMQKLLNELLELSRIGRMMNDPQTVSMNDLVDSALENVRGQLDANNIKVQIVSPQGAQPNLPAVYGDRQRLIEVLQNLIDNAAKFMGDQPDPVIEIGQQGEQDGKPIFFVKDNGVGIAPEYHERIFGLFDKLDANSDGTGVGLALVKRIIEFHGGRIWVESEGIGKGTTFNFTLPVSTGKKVNG